MIEKRVVSFDLSKRLNELGVKKESIFLWDFNHPIRISDIKGNVKSFTCDSVFVRPYKYDPKNPFPFVAFTASEVLEMLPNSIMIENEDEMYLIIKKEWIGYYEGTVYTSKYSPLDDGVRDTPFCNSDKNLSNSLANLLIYLIENKLVSVEDLN